MRHSLVVSADGSNTLKLLDYDECYHSSNGACAEALHIYIKCGVEWLWQQLEVEKEKKKEKKLSGGNSGITIYDIGLGTALNCMVALAWQQSLLAAGKPAPHLHFNGIEKYPIELQEALSLNFPEHLAELFTTIPLTRLKEWFYHIHSCNWEEDVEIAPQFILKKHCGDITSVDGNYFASNKFSSLPCVVFYDTFSPATQPQLWSKDIFCKIADNVAHGSILTTYCSKGIVKQALRDAGFTVERLAGPPGKRHIVRAVVI